MNSCYTDAYQGTRESEVDGLLRSLLFIHLRDAGAFRGGGVSAEAILSKHLVMPAYKKWLQETLEILSRGKHLERAADGLYSPSSIALDVSSTELWATWNETEKRLKKGSTIAAFFPLLKETMKDLPRILTKRKLATETIFPESSMHLVERIYRNNDEADCVNAILAEEVVDYIKDILLRDVRRKISILEIGAGTGGTTADILHELGPFSSNIEEYCYSDISKAFLQEGEKKFSWQSSFMKYRMFNVNRSPEAQNIASGSYDVVIAANVLHATPNIQKTLENVRCLLKRGGLLLLNEISENNLLLHLTFGLLEGWWLFDDEDVRMVGGPALSGEGWRRILAQNGFGSVRVPVMNVGTLGLQVVSCRRSMDLPK